MSALLAQIGEQQVAGFFLVLARIGPLFLVAPLFSSPMLPARAKGVAALGLAFGLTPVVTRGAHIPVEALPLAELLVKEALVGLAFAYTISILFAAVEIAGAFLDTMSGFAYGALVDPLTGARSAVLAQLYTLLAVMVFIAIDGDVWMIQGLDRTYDLVPLEASPALAPLVAGVHHAFVGVFAAALEVVAPVVLALLVTDIAFGIVSRSVPQLNVFAVGFPAKILVTLLIVGVSLPFAGNWIADQLQSSIGDALRALRTAAAAWPVGAVG